MCVAKVLFASNECNDSTSDSTHEVTDTLRLWTT